MLIGMQLYFISACNNNDKICEFQETTEKIKQ